MQRILAGVLRGEITPAVGGRAEIHTGVIRETVWITPIAGPLQIIRIARIAEAGEQNRGGQLHGWQRRLVTAQKSSSHAERAVLHLSRRLREMHSTDEAPIQIRRRHRTVRQQPAVFGKAKLSTDRRREGERRRADLAETAI